MRGKTDSALRQVLEVQSVLGTALGLLHLPQSGERANPHGYPQQFALDGVLGKLGVTGHPLRPLDDVEAPERGHRCDVAAPADDAKVSIDAERPVAGGRQGRLQISQGLGQAFQVVGVRVRDHVQILGAADEAVCADGDAADHDELDAVAAESVEQRAEVELGQRDFVAAPLIALSCLHSAWTRASRSLIGARRSASRRISRARSNSSMSPLSAMSAMRPSLTALFAAFVLFLALTPTAQATYDPIGTGQTKLVLDKRFASFLHKQKIKLLAKNGAKRKGRKILLPVNGGNVDPTLGQGEIASAGTLLFQAGARKVPLRQIRARTKHDTLLAKVGGSQLKVASSAKRKTARAGFGTKYVAKKLKLTAKVATRLNKKLRPKTPFKAGQPLGNLIANAQPSLATILDQGRASISLDPSFTAKMDSLFVSINPIFPAEHPGPFSFPVILNGALAPDGSQGTLRTGGAFEFLQLGAGQVFQDELWLDLGARSDSAEVDVEPTPAFPGKLGRVGAYDLGAAQISSDPSTRTISLNGPLTLSAATAQTFNEAFAEGKGAFSAGEPLGTLSFAAVAQ